MRDRALGSHLGTHLQLSRSMPSIRGAALSANLSGGLSSDHERCKSYQRFLPALPAKTIVSRVRFGVVFARSFLESCRLSTRAQGRPLFVQNVPQAPKMW